MNKKIIGIIIITLLIGTTFSAVGLPIKKVFAEIIDQQNSTHDINTFVIENVIRAQSFVPTKNKLTRIELFICREGSINSDLVVSIREDLHGSDLCTVTKQANQIPSGTVSQDWIEFDFEDIQITVGNKYYIICSTTEGNLDSAYVLGMAKNDPYPHGDAWEYGVFTGYVWEKMVDYNQNPYDLSFKTYCQKTKDKNMDLISLLINRLVDNFPYIQSYLSYFFKLI